jgi:hypothetical protein
MTIMLKTPNQLIHNDLRTSLQWSHDRTFSGFIFDAADPGRKFVVELFVDGYPVKSARATDHVGALAATGTGDSCYGFTFSLDDVTLDHGAVVEARVANLGTMIG